MTAAGAALGMEGEEHRREKDDKSSDDISQRHLYTGFGFDGRSGKPTSCGMSTKERFDYVGKANGNEL